MLTFHLIQMLRNRGCCNKYYLCRTSKVADPNLGLNDGPLLNVFECEKQKCKWVKITWPTEIFEEKEFSTSKFGSDMRSENAEIKCLCSVIF